jgi:hypothetical protein
MRKHLKLIAAGIVLFVAGCQPVASPVIGLIYLDAKGPIAATQATGTREGKACAQSIMALVGTGDASIEAAKRAGGIQEVASVDHTSTNILGIYGEFCTVVRGK